MKLTTILKNIAAILKCLQSTHPNLYAIIDTVMI